MFLDAGCPASVLLISDAMLSLSRAALAAALLAITLSVVPTALASTQDPSAAPPVAASGQLMEEEMFQRLNADRDAAGVPELAFSAKLGDLASTRADGLLTSGGALSHFDPTGRPVLIQILDTNRIHYGLAGENLAQNNFSRGQTVDVANTMLMNSPTHRANILNPRFVETGIGVAGPNPQGRYYYVQLFLEP